MPLRWQARREREYVLGLARATSDLGEEQVDTEGRVLVVKVSLQLCDLFTEHVWRVSDTADDTETTSICDSGRELWSSSHVHAGKHYRVLDLQQVGKLGAKLL